jgi:hypothetical protein
MESTTWVLVPMSLFSQSKSTQRGHVLVPDRLPSLGSLLAQPFLIAEPGSTHQSQQRSQPLSSPRSHTPPSFFHNLPCPHTHTLVANLLLAIRRRRKLTANVCRDHLALLSRAPTDPRHSRTPPRPTNLHRYPDCRPARPATPQTSTSNSTDKLMSIAGELEPRRSDNTNNTNPPRPRPILQSQSRQAIPMPRALPRHKPPHSSSRSRAEPSTGHGCNLPRAFP